MLVASLFYTDVTTAEFVQDLIFFLLLLLLSSFVIGKPFLSFNKVSVRVAVFCNVTSVLRSNGKWRITPTVSTSISESKKECNANVCTTKGKTFALWLGNQLKNEWFFLLGRLYLVNFRCFFPLLLCTACVGYLVVWSSLIVLLLLTLTLAMADLSLSLSSTFMWAHCSMSNNKSLRLSSSSLLQVLLLLLLLPSATLILILLLQVLTLLLALLLNVSFDTILKLLVLLRLTYSLLSLPVVAFYWPYTTLRSLQVLFYIFCWIRCRIYRFDGNDTTKRGDVTFNSPPRM